MAIDTGVRATLVDVLVTVGSWKEKGIKLRNVEKMHLILFKNSLLLKIMLFFCCCCFLIYFEFTSNPGTFTHF